MNDATTIGFRRRHLPHWTVADRSYFVTFRLKGSLPAKVLDELRREKDEFLAQRPERLTGSGAARNGRPTVGQAFLPDRVGQECPTYSPQYVRHSCLTLREDALNEFEKARFAKIETILDAASTGPKSLETPAVAAVVANAFAWLEDTKGWRVHALTVMPNHVHALLRNERGENHRLNAHLGILKGYTAREANRILERTGSFWMDENFDHWCRNEDERVGYVGYIRQNPVKAGLVSRPEDWPWTRVK